MIELVLFSAQVSATICLALVGVVGIWKLLQPVTWLSATACLVLTILLAFLTSWAIMEETVILYVK